MFERLVNQAFELREPEELKKYVTRYNASPYRQDETFAWSRIAVRPELKK